MPLEYFLTNYKRIMIKDSAVNAVCHGAKILLPGVIRFDNGISPNNTIVIITSKGEAVALAIALMGSSEMISCDHGTVARPKRVIMQRNLYDKQWGLGPVHLKKKEMIANGKLDKYGKPNENTPTNWKVYLGSSM
ncbi:MAG: centromere/microtubule-binding protein cbf5 [Paramarteilia canceri]